MKFSSKRTMARILAASMLVTSVFSNMFVANASVADDSSAVETGSAVSLAADGENWILHADMAAKYPNGINPFDALDDNVLSYNGGATAWPTDKANVYTFNNGEYATVSGEFQMGNGNQAANATPYSVGDVLDAGVPATVEKGLLFTLTEATDITVYGAPASGGVNTADVILVDATDLAAGAGTTVTVVDTGVITKDGSNVTVPTLTAPGAGTFMYMVPAKQTSLNIAAIKYVTAGDNPTPTESTTEATTEETTVETTEATTEETTVETTEATTEGTTEETTEVTTVLGEDEVAINVSAELVGSQVKATYNLVGNSDAKGFNNYTITLDYDPALLAPASIEDGDITLTVTDATGNTSTVNATGSIDTTTGKVALVIDQSAVDSENNLQEFTTDGALFTVVYDVIGSGEATIGASVGTLNTVSKDDTIVSTLNVIVVPATVALGGETTESTTEDTTEVTTEGTTETTTLGEHDIKAEAGNIVVTPGTNTVRVPINITHNVGMCSIGVGVEYDASALKPVSVENGDVYPDSAMTVGDLTKNPFGVSYVVGTGDVTNDGVLYYVTFEIINPDAIGTYRVAAASYSSPAGVPLDGVVSDTDPDAKLVYGAAGSVSVQEETTSESTTEATTEESTSEATTIDETSESTTDAAVESSTVDQTSESTTIDATSESTTSESTETTTRRRSSGGGGGGGSNRIYYTNNGTTEAASEATTSSSNDNKGSIITKDVKVTIGKKAVIVGATSYGVDVAPYIQTSSSSTLVPLRVVAIAILGEDPQNADSLSSIVKWDGTTKTATIIAGNDVINFTAGSDTMIVNGTAQLMDNGVKAEITDARMYVPFRALGKALGVQVDWDSTTKTATYVAPKAVQEEAEEETPAEEEANPVDSAKALADEIGTAINWLAENASDDDVKTEASELAKTVNELVENLSDETVEAAVKTLDETNTSVEKLAEKAGLSDKLAAYLAETVADTTTEATTETTTVAE